MAANGDAVQLLANGAKGFANYPLGRVAPSASRTLYVSGTASRGANGRFDGVTTNSDGSLEFNVEEQTASTLRNIEAIIKKASENTADLSNVVDATIFLVDIENEYTSMNTVWNKFYPDASKAPARTAIGVRALPSPKLRVEFKCTALLP